MIRSLRRRAVHHFLGAIATLATLIVGAPRDAAAQVPPTLLQSGGSDGYNRVGVLNGETFFAGANARLWKSDGTALGTVQVSTVKPYGSPAEFVEFGNALYFPGDDGVHGAELWKTDGTPAGTVMVKDIATGFDCCGTPLPARPMYLKVFNGLLFFSADDYYVNSRELWVSDGTEAGTVLLKDIRPGNYLSDPQGFSELNSELFFFALSADYHWQLWKTDGTAAGTVLAHDIDPVIAHVWLSSLTVFDGSLYFWGCTSADFSPTCDLWKSDGTDASVVADLNQESTGDIGVSTNGVFFAGFDPVHGFELWKTDGTTTGLVEDLNPNPCVAELWMCGSFPYSFRTLGGLVLFIGYDFNASAYRLYRSDGTEAGTYPLASDAGFGYGSDVLDGIAYFNARNDGTHGNELWQTDGTVAGTTLVVDLHAGTTDSYPSALAVVDDVLYIGAWDSSVWTAELWALRIGPPDTSITSIALDPASPNGTNGWYTSGVHVTVNVVEGITGLLETRCVLDPPVPPASFNDLPSGCSYTGAGLDLFANGEHTLYAASLDNDTSVSPVVSSTLKIDNLPPFSTITFPTTATYDVTSWNAGCGTPGVGDVCGTALDVFGSGLQKVEVSVRRNGVTSKYWDGSSFTSTPEVFQLATGDWSRAFAFSNFNPGSYTLHVRATDNAGNVEAGPTVTFTIAGAAPNPCGVNGVYTAPNTCTYTQGQNTGYEDRFEVPAGVQSIHVVAVGGRGGSACDPYSYPPFGQGVAFGGYGGRVTGDVGVSPGSTVLVGLAGNGKSLFSSTCHLFPAAPGGFNGGGNGSGGDQFAIKGGGGGGASDVRTESRLSPVTLNSRLLVAAGGGGGGGPLYDAPGTGGNAGQAGANGGSSYGYQGGGGGQAGTLVAGGAGGTGVAGGAGTFGAGGAAGYSPNQTQGGGGGGGAGYFGGGAGGTGVGPGFSSGGGGGGGSNYTDPLATGVTDGTDNTGTPSITITWVESPNDVVPPVVTVPSDISALATNPAGAIVTFSATAFDLVDGALTPTCVPASGSNFLIGSTLVTCTATDVAGNIGSASFNVVVSTPSVTVTSPNAPLSWYIGTTQAITFSHNLGAGQSVTIDVSRDGGATWAAVDSTTTSPATGQYLWLVDGPVTSQARIRVTWLTDPSVFDVSDVNFAVVTDTTPPVVTVPGPITTEALFGTGASVTFGASATDDLDGPLVADCDPESGTYFLVGQTTVTCSATDSHGNTGSASFTVTVTDTTPPLVTVPSPISVFATSPAGAIVSFTASAFDSVDGSITTTCLPASGSTFAVGSTTVTCSATDSHGNTGFAGFTVTVTVPVVTITSPISAQNWFIGQTRTISFFHNLGEGQSIALEISRDDGLTWSPLTTFVTTLPTLGSYEWLVSGPVTTTARFRATWTGNANATDTTPAEVAIVNGITVTVPNDALTWHVGDHVIQFDHNLAPGQLVNIDVSGDGGLTWSPIAAGMVLQQATGGSFPWEMEGPITTQARIRVSWDADPSVFDISDVNFTIAPPLDTTAPVVTVPGPTTAEATSGAGATVAFFASALDNVDGPLTPTCVPASGSLFVLGPTTVTCSATDAQGNTGSANFVVTVVDTTAPVVTVPSPISATATTTAGAVVTFTTSALDSVDGSIAPTCVPASGSTFAVDNTLVTCSATDAHGNTGSNFFTVTVTDTTIPVVTVPAPITVEATGSDGATVTFSVSATDALDGPLTPTCLPASGSEFPVGATTVTCTAVDSHGNTGSNNFTITVVDTTAPVVTVPAPITAEATSAAGASVPFIASALDLVDGGIVATCVPSAASVFALGPTTVTCSATDAAGNTGQASFVVTVVDTTGPIVTVPAPLSVEATSSGGATATFSSSALDSVDGPRTATCVPASGSLFALGSTTVTCSATDTRGNIGSANFTVTVEDTTPPVVTVPSTISVAATGESGAAVTFTASALDIVDGSIVAVCVPVSGSTFDVGSTTVTCTATDAHENTGSASFTVTVTDTIAPVVTVPGPTTAEATSAAGATVAFFASALDNVDGPLTATCVPASGSLFVLGPTTVTCSATDGQGNTGSANFVVTVVDTTAPVVTVPSPISATATTTAGAVVTFTTSALDSVDGAIAPTCVPASGSTFAVDDTLVTCSATDAHGNTGSNFFTVTVTDTTIPVVTVPAPITAEATSGGGATVTFSVSATDALDGPLTPTCLPASGFQFPVSVTTVTCTAVDPHGNSGSNNFTVTVTDTTSPVVTVPAPITAEATSAAGASVPFVANALDLVDGGIAPTCVPTSASVFEMGPTTVTCSATDAHGNTGQASFVVTVVDTTSPVVTVPPFVSVEAANASGATATFVASALDSVDGSMTPTCVPASGSLFALGSTTVTCSSTDAHGNLGSATLSVSVVDTTDPVVTAPSDITAEATSSAGAAVTFTSSATDSVDGPLTTTCGPPSGLTFTIGTTPVTCSATDAHGNTGSAGFNVTVQDTTPPVVTVPSTITVPATSASGATVTFSASALDIVNGSIPPTCVPASGSTFAIGTTPVTCSATDAHGNTGSATFNVVVTSTVITVTSPNTAVSWPVGASRNITFSHSLGVGQAVAIEMSRDGGTTWSSLNPAFVTISATTGTYAWVVTGPTTALGRIRVSRVGSPSIFDVSDANFSITDSITVGSPNGGESWNIGSTQTISWTHLASLGTVNIDVSRDGGATWSAVTTATPDSSPTGGSYLWTVTGPATTTARIRVTRGNDAAVSDISNTNFAIANPTVTVTVPNTAVVWREGESRNITFSHNLGAGQPVTIDVSRDGGTTWAVEATNVPTTTASSGTFAWLVTGPPTTQARIRVSRATGTPAASDISDVNFTILDRITVTAPNTAVAWAVGTTQSITWNHNLGIGESVNIDVSRDGGATWTVLAAGAPNVTATTGTYAWVVTAPTTTEGRIRVSRVANPVNMDVSDVNFTVTDSLTVTVPNTAVSWPAGTIQTISWTHNASLGAVNIDVSRDGGTTWASIATNVADSTPTSGSYPWLVTGPVTTTARIRVTRAGDASVTDMSNVNFTIVAPALTVTAPNTALVLRMGSVQNVTFTHSLGIGQPITIEISRDGGATWSLAANTTTTAVATSTYAWLVTGPPASQAKIRVSWTTDPTTVFDTSDVNFAIIDRITVTAPNTPVLWSVGSSQSIRWAHNLGTGESVNIAVSRDGGLTWSTLATNVPNTAATTGLYTWVVSGPITAEARIKVTRVADTTNADTSDVNFSVTDFMTVNSPNTAVSWAIGTNQTISWSHQPSLGAVNIELSRDAGATWTDLATNVADTAPSGGTYSWLVSGLPTTQALVRVTRVSDPAVKDVSNVTFSIVTPALTVTAPNTALTLRLASLQNITFTHNLGPGQPVAIEVSRDAGTTWSPVANVTTTTSTTFTYSWTVTGPLTALGRIRASWTTDPAFFDESNVNFAIVDRVTVTAPNGGVAWTVGSTRSITWQHNLGLAETVNIEVSRDGGATWTALAANVPNTTATTGTYSWIVTGPVTSLARVRIVRVADPTNSDVSDADSAITDVMTVTSPNSAVSWAVGTSQTVSWTHQPALGKVNIDLSRDGGATWSALAANVDDATPAGGSWTWLVTGPVTAAAKIRVTRVSDPAVTDVGNTNFSVVAAAITVTQPNAGALQLRVATPYSVVFTHNLGPGQPVAIELTRDGGASWELVTNVTTTAAASITYSWPVTGPPTTQARIRASWTTNPTVNDESNVNFTIVDRLNVTAPNSATIWSVGSLQSITWSHNLGTGESVNIDISRDGGTTYTSLATNVPNTTAVTGTYPWVVTGPITSAARVRISRVAAPGVVDSSDVNFTISDSITVTAPNTGVSWTVGTTQNITWTHPFGQGTVNIDITRDNGGSWTQLVAGAPDTNATSGSYSWLVTGPATTQAKIRVTRANDPAVSDISNLSFTIAAPAITVTSPNTAVTWASGTNQTITFSHNLGPGVLVNIDVSRDGGTTYSPVTTATTTIAATLGVPWTVTAPATTQARIRVSVASNPAIQDASNVNFTITAPSITVTAPNISENWLIGVTRNITFSHVNLGAGVQVFIEVSRDGGATWTLITTATTTIASTLSTPWMVDGPTTSQARIRIRKVTDPSVFDISDVNFSIV